MRLLPQLGPVVAVGRQELDLSRVDDIRETIRELRPRLIVNAAAYTAVDGAEGEESAAGAINKVAVEVMASEAKIAGATLVHYSTDYVFDGTKGKPYEEGDPTNPLNAYGRTKLAGEEAIRASGASHLILRTSWVYATRGKNFLLTILRIASEREELRIVSDQIGAPTCARDLADATCKILAGTLDRSKKGFELRGCAATYHISGGGQTSWHGFAKSILEQARTVNSAQIWLEEATKGRPLIARRVVPVSTAEFNSPTKRPAYSVLSNARLKLDYGIALPDWAEQLKACFNKRQSKPVDANKLSARAQSY